MMRLSSVQIYRQQNSTGQNKIHHVNQTVGCWEVYFFTLYKARPGRMDKSLLICLWVRWRKEGQFLLRVVPINVWPKFIKNHELSPSFKKILVILPKPTLLSFTCIITEPIVVFNWAVRLKGYEYFLNYVLILFWLFTSWDQLATRSEYVSHHSSLEWMGNVFRCRRVLTHKRTFYVTTWTHGKL